MIFYDVFCDILLLFQHGVVEQGPVDGAFAMASSTGGAAFSNPVYEIKEAQEAIRDFKPPFIDGTQQSPSAAKYAQSPDDDDNKL